MLANIPFWHLAWFLTGIKREFQLVSLLAHTRAHVLVLGLERSVRVCEMYVYATVLIAVYNAVWCRLASEAW